MSVDAIHQDATVALTAAGVTVLADVSAGGLPVITYWGRELPALDAAQAAALVSASITVAGTNNIEPTPRVAILPEHHTGWTGRPGLRGSFAGVGWSPAFRTSSVTVDGTTVTGFTATGPATVECRAVDDAGRLELLLVLSFPVPAAATELLDFAGRHNLERVPERSPLRAGSHVRENRKGRTGADSAYVLHAGTAGFDFGSGDVWAVHTAWSGNHTHYAERVFTGEQLIGGGELLLPGEVRLATGGTYRSPWIYGAHGVGLDRVARRFHRHLRGRDRRVPVARPVTLNVWEAVYFQHDLDR